MRTAPFLKRALTAIALLGIPLAGSIVAQRPVLAQQPAQPPQAPAEAPTDISDTQIEQFAAAYAAIQTIQQQVQPDMVEAVEAEGLTVEEFEQILAMVRQSPEADAQILPEQSQQFTAAYERVVEIQASARADMQAAIQAEGLTVEEFEQILAMAQQDPALAERINNRLSSEE